MGSKARRADVVLNAHADLGEGVWWDASRGELLWIDLLAGTIHSLDPVSLRCSCLVVGQPVGMVAGRVSGGVVAGVRDGVGFADLERGTFEMVVEIEADNPANRMNDGACDAAGRLWLGTTAFDHIPEAGTLYRVDPDLRVSAMISGVTTSNGIDWSPDGRTMYYTDTATGRVDAFDYDLETGSIANRRVLTAMTVGEGLPDGLTVDAEGTVWVAMWGGYSVRRYAPDGRLLDVVALPVANVTSVAFGGPDLSQLFITSARDGLTAEQAAHQPLAGAIFVVDAGVNGRLPNPFAG